MQMLFLKHLHMCFCPKNRRSGCPRADGGIKAPLCKGSCHIAGFRQYDWGIVKHWYATIPQSKIKDCASLFAQRGPFSGYIPPVFARKQTFYSGKGGSDTVYYINIVYSVLTAPKLEKLYIYTIFMDGNRVFLLLSSTEKQNQESYAPVRV